MNYTFNKSYFLWSLSLFIAELYIGFFFNDAWIRPYFGDFLVVILLYCLVKSFFPAQPKFTLLGVLLFAYLIEMLQYFSFVVVLGLQNIAIARTLIGTSFSWIDMAMYTLGILFVYIIETFLCKNTKAINNEQRTGG